MVKFLLSLPLGIFIVAEAIVFYLLGDIIFKAATDSASTGLVGEWNFFQIVLAMLGITIGTILAAFFYSTVVLKPVFFPALEEEKPKKQKQRVVVEKKKKSKKPLIILLIIGAVIIAAGVAGFIFREQVFDFINTFIGLETDWQDEDSEDDIMYNTQSEDYEYDEEGGEDISATEPEESEQEVSALYEDLEYNWTMYYPASLGVPSVEPIETGILRDPPSDTEPKLLYWSTDNVNGYAGAEDYAAADPSGILSTAVDYQILNENIVICRFDDEDLNGSTFSGVRFWYVDPDGIASADISCETAEMADEWYTLLSDGAVYIEKAEEFEE